MRNKLTILITRPDPQGSALCQLIEANGDHAIHFPTIEIVPPADETLLQQQLSQLGEQDWLIFISPQAVITSIPHLRRAWPQLPDTVRWAAVGAGTAQALKEAGYNEIIYPPVEFSTEALLALPEFHSISGKKIAIIKGEGGRELLQTTLQERGAHVLLINSYRRALPEIDPTRYCDLFINNKIDAAICTSFEGIANLKKLIGEKAWKTLKVTPCIVMSERIKSLAHHLGFQTIWVVKSASHTAILNLLAEKRNEICQINQAKW